MSRLLRTENDLIYQKNKVITHPHKLIQLRESMHTPTRYHRCKHLQAREYTRPPRRSCSAVMGENPHGVRGRNVEEALRPFWKPNERSVR
ncbi:hypothetical protein SOMG_03846 [Schizosaccharomyces osmophilus]|uniref:Uncharacterized protein n=1 Tax=Schizosaccharomyces osmophilus TaxID=2545709 RepID=A0AAF0AY81_9SCHI|nr:uncharacterized protein SOMG_03846 [Schizosaccharomyces osmophilus]WBW74508.1 hypothetical protein SOMG_03846 [Schizosaccharomyces osmophilus]